MPIAGINYPKKINISVEWHIIGTFLAIQFPRMMQWGDEKFKRLFEESFSLFLQESPWIAPTFIDTISIASGWTLVKLIMAPTRSRYLLILSSKWLKCLSTIMQQLALFSTPRALPVSTIVKWVDHSFRECLLNYLYWEKNTIFQALRWVIRCLRGGFGI